MSNINVDAMTDTYAETIADFDTDNEEMRKGRIFKISDTTFKILCQADKKNLDPTVGLENLVSMYLSLTGPIDFRKLDLERARQRAKKLNLL